MIDLSAAQVQDQPFPHCVVDELFGPATFARLAGSFPHCPPASGPTGFTLHRGDAQFDRLLADNSDWRELFEACNSSHFVTALAGMFASEIDRSCRTARAELRFVDHIESRREKERPLLGAGSLGTEDIHIRFDFMQGREAYRRAAHLDHRRRLATMLIYFESPGAETFQGGDLVLHDGLGNAVARIAPAANRAVIFPCSERSWHSVEAVRACRRPRSMIQVSATSRHALWPDALLPGMEPAGPTQLWRRALRRLGRP